MKSLTKLSIFLLLPSIAHSYVELNLTNLNEQESISIVFRDNVLADSILNTTIDIGDLCITKTSQVTCNVEPWSDIHTSTSVRWDPVYQVPGWFNWGAFPVNEVSDYSTITFLDLESVNTNWSTHLQVSFAGAYNEHQYISSYDDLGDWQVTVSEVPLPAGIYLFLSGLVSLGAVRSRK